MHRSIPTMPLPEHEKAASSTAALFPPRAPEGKSTDRPPFAAEAYPAVPPRIACRIVRQLIVEMVQLSGERVLRRRDSRRATCHIRQIAMYVCHVILQISLSDIGLAFGKDRTTVGHACNVVEDRRDHPDYDEFVAAAERIVLSVLTPAGYGNDE